MRRPSFFASKSGLRTNNSACVAPAPNKYAIFFGTRSIQSFRGKIELSVISQRHSTRKTKKSTGKFARLFCRYPMPERELLENLPQAVSEAVKVYWATRERQSQKQKATGGADQGLRSAVTGGAQMNGFVQLITNLVI